MYIEFVQKHVQMLWVHTGIASLRQFQYVSKTHASEIDKENL